MQKSADIMVGLMILLLIIVALFSIEGVRDLIKIKDIKNKSKLTNSDVKIKDKALLFIVFVIMVAYAIFISR